MYVAYVCMYVCVYIGCWACSRVRVTMGMSSHNTYAYVRLGWVGVGLELGLRMQYLVRQGVALLDLGLGVG